MEYLLLMKKSNLMEAEKREVTQHNKQDWLIHHQQPLVVSRSQGDHIDYVEDRPELTR